MKVPALGSLDGPEADAAVAAAVEEFERKLAADWVTVHSPMPPSHTHAATAFPEVRILTQGHILQPFPRWIGKG